MFSLYLPMKIYPVCITSTPTAYATIDIIIIHHVYKPDFAVCVPFFLDRKLGPVCHQIGGRVRSIFLLGQLAPYHLTKIAISYKHDCHAVTIFVSKRRHILFATDTMLNLL